MQLYNTQHNRTAWLQMMVLALVHLSIYIKSQPNTKEEMHTCWGYRKDLSDEKRYSRLISNGNLVKLKRFTNDKIQPKVHIIIITIKNMNILLYH